MHVDPDEDLDDLEEDWNILRGRTAPSELFHVLSRPQGKALLRLKCHDFLKESVDSNGLVIPRKWVVNVTEVIYQEPQIQKLPAFQQLIKQEKLDLPQSTCFPTLSAAVKVLQAGRNVARTRLRNRQREVVENIAKLQVETDAIDFTIDGWPELPGGVQETPANDEVNDFGTGVGLQPKEDDPFDQLLDGI